MSRDYKVYLEDILEASGRIQDYLSGRDWSDASRDPKTFDAVIRNLQIIGEAVKNLPDPFKKSEPGIEWRKIGGFRDIIVHQYFAIDESIIGEVIKNKLPGLEKTARDALQKKSFPGAQEPRAVYRAGKPKPKKAKPRPRRRKRK